MYRKGGMYLNNVVSIIACVFMVLSKPAHSYELLIVGRFFMGLACGTDVTFDRLEKKRCRVLFQAMVHQSHRRTSMKYLQNIYVEHSERRFNWALLCFSSLPKLSL